MSSVIREYFPGANTPEGFFSYYDYILNPYEAKKIIILKGGPGTGKSTLMRNIATHLTSLGYETELLHCSSDPDSLDGVCARKCGFLIVDGTRPHIVDPKAPGAVEQIVNLGDCWNTDKIIQNKNAILNVNSKISKCFEISYHYLASAKNLYNRIYANIKIIDCKKSIAEICENMKKEFSLCDNYGKISIERKAFLSAFTPIGEKDYIKTFLKNSSKVYKLKTSSLHSSSFLLNKIKDLFANAGHDTLSFYSPMFPSDYIEHLYVPSLNLFFTSEKHIDFNKKTDALNEIILDIKTIKDHAPYDLGYEYETYNLLINKAIDSLSQAKKLHDELEMLYKPHMDFGKIDVLGKNIINSLK